MDQEWNCILEICCSPLEQNDKRRKAMAKLLMAQGMGQKEAEEYAPIVLNAFQPLFELLQPFINFITKLARGKNFE